jgi:LytR cell envelope-related transcriptional attenuator
MVLFALSFQGQVEKYGAYVGIAAFFGLAVLSLLYFSQARELKRLREWAERAPERARELERRAVAQATATVARRVPSMSGAPAKGAIAPPRRLAEMPAPATAAAGTAQATELAEAVEADPATNGNVRKPPFGPGGTVPAGPLPAVEEHAEQAAAASANGGPAGGADGDEAPASPGTVEAAPDEVAVAGAVEAAPDEVAVAGADDAARDEVAVAGAAEAARDEVALAGGAEAPQDEDAAAHDEAVVAPGDKAAAAVPGATEPAGFPALDDGTGEAEPPASVPGEVPPAPAVPRATPAQRVGAGPRPQPMPLRQATPSATPRGGGRRPGAPATRRPAGSPTKPPGEGRSAGTVALLVGLAVLILGGGAFLGSQLLGGDEEPTAPNQAAPPPSETAEEESGGGAGGDGAAQAAPPAETNVAVLNGTTFPGLAGQLADQVAAKGYQRGVTETNIRDQTIQQSIVYYADGFRPSAREVGGLFSIDQFEPLDSETASLAPGADVVVLAGADQTP